MKAWGRVALRSGLEPLVQVLGLLLTDAPPEGGGGDGGEDILLHAGEVCGGGEGIVERGVPE